MENYSTVSVWDTIDVINDPKYKLSIKLDFMWLYYQALVLYPMAAITIYRFFRQIPNEEYYDLKKEIPSSYLDEFCRVFIIIGSLYYFVSGILLVPNIKSPCQLFSLLHHMVSVYGSRHWYNVTYYPWFMYAPLTFHSLLVVYPNLGLLNYIYLMLLIIWYYALGQKPYKCREGYQKVQSCGLLLLPVILLLWLFSCDNRITMH